MTQTLDPAAAFKFLSARTQEDPDVQPLTWTIAVVSSELADYAPARVWLLDRAADSRVDVRWAALNAIREDLGEHFAGDAALARLLQERAEGDPDADLRRLAARSVMGFLLPAPVSAAATV